MFKVKDGIRIGATEFVDASRNVAAGTITASNVTLTGELRGPATMYIDPAAVGDNTGTLVIRGNLQVDGTTTTINSTTLTVDDLNIVLADGAANAAAANGAGITIGGAGATFTYTSANDRWNLNKDLVVANVYGALKGNADTATSATDSTKLPLAGGTLTGALTINTTDVAFRVEESGTSQAWRARLGSFNSSADSSSFLGNYTGRAGVFGHNNALSAWGPLWVNTLGQYGQGTVYLSSSTFVKSATTDTDNAILHAGNYNSYSPTLTGGGASGTWGISVTGNAATVTNGLYKTSNSIATSITFNTTADNWLWLEQASSGNSWSSGPSTANFAVGANRYVISSSGVSSQGELILERGTTKLLEILQANLQYKNNIVLHATNYNSYAPTLTGGGASGTWGISVSGNAATVTNGVYTTSNVLLNRGSVADTALNTTTTTGIYNVNYTGFSKNMLVWNTGGSTGIVQFEVNYGNTGEIRLRNQTDSTTWSSWRTFLTNQSYTDYTVTKTGTGASGTWGINITGSAGTVTARTLTIGNTGKSVDHSANVSWSLAEIGAYAATNPSGYTSNAGTVTSVSGTGTVSGLTLSGTVTSSGNLSLGGTLSVLPSNFASQTANTVLAAPNGAAGTPTFRALVAADIPTLNQNTTGSAATLTTARTFTIGSTGRTFNGSANVTWTLADIGAAASSHTHDDRYYTETESDARFLRLDFPATTAANGWASNSGTWTNASSSTNWGSYKPGDDAAAGYAYNDAPGWAQFNVPAGYSTVYIGQLRWSSGGYFDVHAVKSDGTLVFRGRYLSLNSIETTDHGGDHDGQQIIKVSGLDGMTAVRITNVTGRLHLQGLGWTAEQDTAGTQVSETHWDLIYNKPTVLTTSNYTSYSPSLTGSGASGTWGINITGSAGTVTARTLTIGNTGKSVDHSANISWSLAEIGAYAATNPSGYTSNTGTVTSVSGTGTVSGLTLSGTVTSSGNLTLGGTLSASIDNITDEHRLFNNMGDNHGTRTAFDASTPSYNFGWRFVQGSGNGPGVNSASQYYSLYVGLGNDYPATGGGSYGMQLAIPRNVTTPYLAVRYNENNTLGSWQKISAGYADTAGNAATATALQTARTINGVSFNGTANITVADSTKLPLSGGTMTGAITFAAGQTWPTFNQNTTGNAASSSYADTLLREDNRTISPSVLTSGRSRFGFTSWNNNNTSPYADFLHFRSYTDSSGGSDNLVMFRKDAIGMRIWQQTYGSSTAYSSYVDVITSSNYTSYSPSLTGSGASGTWAINITGSAPASGITGQTGMWTSAARPGPYRLYRRDDNSNYSVQTYWTGTYWRLYGYSGDNGHADTHVGYSDNSGQLGGISSNRAILKRRSRIHTSDGTSLDSSIVAPEMGFSYGGSGEPTGPYIAFGGLSGNIDYSCQLAGAYSGGGNNFKIRTRNDDQAIWNSWRTIITDGNYTSYSPTLTGSGASGTWSISITGNAGTATALQTARTINGVSFNGTANITVADSTKLPLSGGTMTGTLNMGNNQVNSAGQFNLNNGFTISQGSSSYGQFSNWVYLPGFHGFYSAQNSAHFYPNDNSYGSWKISGTRNGWHGIHFDSGSTLMMNSNQVGFHREGYGWQMLWSAGVGYIYKGDPGSGTQATILDSSNYNSYSPTLTGGNASGTWSINITGNAGTTTVTDDTSSTSTHYLHMGTSTSGAASTKVSSTKLSFQPSTGNLATTGSFSSNNTFGYKNRIINGSMEIDQRNSGAAVNLTASGYAVDRFHIIKTTPSGTVQAFRSTQTAPGFYNSLALSVITAWNPDVSQLAMIQHKIEAFNTTDLEFGTANPSSVTLSFWVRSSITGTYSVALLNSSNSRSYVTTYSINTANTWEKKAITIPGDTASGLWPRGTTAIGLRVNWDLGSGSNLNATTTNQWADGNRTRVSDQVNWTQSTNATFYLTGIQLEKGTWATSYDWRNYTTELQLCKRYYQRINVAIGNHYQAFGGNVPASTRIDFPVTMRTSPTITFVNNSFSLTNGATASYISADGFSYQVNITGSGTYARNDWALVDGAEL